MGAHHSKQSKRRAQHTSSTRHQSPAPLPSQSNYQQQQQHRHVVTRQPLRSQQLQQQRQRASLRQQQEQSSSSHHFVPEQQSQLHLPVSPPHPGYTAEPLLLEDDDDDDDVQRRLSIDFMDSQSSILLKNQFSAVIGGDSMFSSTSSRNASSPSLSSSYDQPLYLPPTMSSITSSSSASSAHTALFSTLSSLSSTASSISSIHIKQAHDATLPILDHHTSTTSHTASSSTLTSPTTATVVDDDENQRVDEAYNTLDRWIMQPDISDRQVVAEAYYPYAVFHYYGLSPTRQPNYPLAYKYFQQAAKENMVLLQTCRDQEQRERILGIISNAQYNLGEMWANGKGVARVDTIKAAQYFRAAADNQHATARYMMGHYCHHGIAMRKNEQPRKNIDQAIEWYTLAAEQGHDKAQTALGTLLLDRQQAQEALKWLHLAADKVRFSLFIIILNDYLHMYTL